MTQAGIAVVAGSGDLPRLIAEDCARAGRAYRVVAFVGAVPDWCRQHPLIEAVLERPGRLLDALREAGCSDVAFAGAMARPSLDPARFDAKGLALAASLLQGDDAMLRKISAFFENEGFRVVGAHEVLAGLLAPAGVLSKAQPSVADRQDAARAFEIVRALGQADVGQAAVVAQGICLGVESIQGTDALLEFVAQTAARFRPDPGGAKGVLGKAPKPGQEWRMDLPVIGPQTIAAAARAGLAGVAMQAGGVLVLGLAETVSEADRLGLFLWGCEAG